MYITLLCYYYYARVLLFDQLNINLHVEAKCSSESYTVCRSLCRQIIGITLTLLRNAQTLNTESPRISVVSRMGGGSQSDHANRWTVGERMKFNTHKNLH